MGERGELARQAMQEGLNGRRVALDLDGDAVGIVADASGQVQLGRQAVDVGPKTNTLHPPGDVQSSPHNRGFERSSVVMHGRRFLEPIGSLSDGVPVAGAVEGPKPA